MKNQIYLKIGDFRISLAEFGRFHTEKISVDIQNKITESIHQIFLMAEKCAVDVKENNGCKGAFCDIPDSEMFIFCSLKDNDYDVCLYNPETEEFTDILTLEEFVGLDEIAEQFINKVENIPKLNRGLVNPELYSSLNIIAGQYYKQGYSPAHPVRAGTATEYVSHRHFRTDETKHVRIEPETQIEPNDPDLER